MEFRDTRLWSTVTQLINILDKWIDYLENGGQIDVIYTDLEEAFDKVLHAHLINKLKFYNINPIRLDKLGFNKKNLKELE